MAKSAELRPPRPPADTPPVKGPIKVIFIVSDFSLQPIKKAQQMRDIKAFGSLSVFNISSIQFFKIS
jgi:hypothetical protein